MARKIYYLCVLLYFVYYRSESFSQLFEQTTKTIIKNKLITVSDANNSDLSNSQNNESTNTMITFTEILACNGTAIYEVQKSQLNFVTSGKLSVLIAYDGMVLLQLNDRFQYGINADTEIVYDDKDPQFTYIFYLKKHTQGQWVLKVNENADEVFSCLNQKCYLKDKNAAAANSINSSSQKNKNSKRKVKQEKPGNKSKNGFFNFSKKEAKTEDNRSSQSQDDSAIFEQKQSMTAQSALIGASKQLGYGLAFTGKYISKGFQSFGGYLSKKVQPATKKTEVSQSTKENIKLAKKTTNTVLTFTSEQVGALFKFGKTLASDAGQTFQKSEKGKQLQENKYYEGVKEGAKTGVTVLANVYEGVVNAVYEVGSGASKGVTKVVGAKYGQDAEQATDGVFQGVGNVAKIVRVPKDQAAKAFKE